MNGDDQYVGDEIAIFVDILVAENDTRSPKKFIQIQHQFIWTPADNKSEHFPDLGHTIKKCRNKLYALKEKQKELSGKNLLDAMRIRTIMGDVRECLKKCQPYINEKEKKWMCRLFVSYHTSPLW